MLQSIVLPFSGKFTSRTSERAFGFTWEIKFDCMADEQVGGSDISINIKYY